MWFGLITLFPEMLAVLNSGITGRALNRQLIQISSWNPRDFTTDKHKTVDDRPYGGGPGMVMLAEPILAAINAAKQVAPCHAKVIYLSPQGKRFNQKAAVNFYQQQQPLIFLAGRYEGIDERIIQESLAEEWSVGDFIVSGGELPALLMIDAITRQIPGVVNTEESISADSLAQGLLKYPQYTRPEVIKNLKVPDILLSGNHQAIEKWRLKASLGRTWLRRPDLLAKKTLTEEEKRLLNEFIQEYLQ